MRLSSPHNRKWKHRSGLIQSLTQQRLSSVKEESNRDARCVIEASCQDYLLYLLDVPKASVKRLRRLGKVIARKSPGASGEHTDHHRCGERTSQKPTAEAVGSGRGTVHVSVENVSSSDIELEAIRKQLNDLTQ